MKETNYLVSIKFSKRLSSGGHILLMDYEYFHTLIIIIIQVSSAVVAARLREQPAPMTAYNASLELLCVIYAIQFCLMQLGAAFPCQPWSLGACRSAAGRCQASWGGWFWGGRDVLEVPPFRNRLTLPSLPALSRPNVGRDQIDAIACPSRLCLFHGTRTVHTSLSC